MKYVSPKYEVMPIDACDVIMSVEAGYTVNESVDDNGVKIGDVTLNADSLFRKYFN